MWSFLFKTLRFQKAAKHSFTTTYSTGWTSGVMDDGARRLSRWSAICILSTPWAKLDHKGVYHTHLPWRLYDKLFAISNGFAITQNDRRELLKRKLTNGSQCGAYHRDRQSFTSASRLLHLPSFGF